MYRDGMADRKVEVMLEAARRYRVKGAALAETRQKMAAGGTMAAASESRLRRYESREAAKRAAAQRDREQAARLVRLYVERKIGLGDFDWVDDPPPDARAAGRPVARIVELLGRSRIGEGFATGFVVPPGLLVTNWHVFGRPEDARSCAAEFGFERNEAGQFGATVAFEIDPAKFFYSDERHDVAVVGLADRPAVGAGTLAAFGAVQLIPSLGKILVGQPVIIVQHPDGKHKHWALDQNTLCLEPDADDLYLLYTSDTLEGSSGSPAFNKDWELVGIHHGGVPRVENGKIMTLTGGVWTKGMPETDIDWEANEGARVSKVLTLLAGVRLSDPGHQRLLDQLLAAAKDPVYESAAPRAGDPIQQAHGATSEGAMQITVHGTANFYFGAGATGVGATVVTPRPAPDAGAAPRPTAAEKKLRFDPDYKNRPGYAPTFLAGYNVPMPDAPRDEVYVGPGGLTVLKYHHFSLVMHRERRLAMWTAANVDYDPKKRRFDRDDFGEDTWKPDPRIPIEAQLEDVEFYAPARKFDRGHLVRRDDGAWGRSEEEEIFANSDTFHWTNCTPQHEHFNRDMFAHHGIWGQLEHHIASQARFIDNKLTVFAGPILSDGDPERDFGSGSRVKVPMAFWKIVVVAEEVDGNPQLRAYGFILDQSEAIERHGWEGRFRPGEFTEQQVSLAAITERSRVEFDRDLHNADPLANDRAESRGRRLRGLESIRFD